MIPMQEDDEQPKSIIRDVIEIYSSDPTLLIWTSAIAVIGASAFLAATVYAISRAGRFQPPRVVLSVVLGLVGLVSILGAILQPQSQALAAVAATAVGGLAAALGTAFDMRSKDDDDVVTEADDPMHRGPTQDCGESNEEEDS